MSRSEDQERLAAYVDGELGPEEKAVVEAHLASSPEDQAAVDQLRRLNDDLGAAYEAPFREMLPAGIRLAIRGGTARQWRRTWRAGAALAVAASIAGLAVVFAPRPSSEEVAPDMIAPGSTLHAFLESEPSGGTASVDDGIMTLLSTFYDGKGQPCREVEILETQASTHALACRIDGAWMIAATVSRPHAPADERDAYAPASGAGDAGFEAVLESVGAGPVLDPAEEEALIENSWGTRPP